MTAASSATGAGYNRARSFLTSKPVQLALFIVLALALKVATFGDLNRHADETFYFLVGQRMHDGLLPYVDVWDRKPFGLFAIYYLIAGISTSVLAYQLVASLFAAVTAYVICLLVSHWSDRTGGTFAGIAYLFIIGPFEGNTGQTPDFYNLLIVSSALLIALELNRLLEGKVGWRIWAAMALCGIAITIKQTTLFESAFFGLCVLFCLFRARIALPRIAVTGALFCLIGALPTLLVAAYFAQAGHWHEFWHAMVTSNLDKMAEGGGGWRLIGIVLRAGLLLLLAVWGLLAGGNDPRARIFLGAWLVAALVGFLSVPNVYGHYTLPLLVPLSVAAGLAFAKARMRVALLVALACYALLWDNPIKGDETSRSIAAMNTMAAMVREHDPGGGLLVFDGPVYLYALTDEPFLSPLVFPQHLNHQIENNVSHLDTHAEIDRILRNRPGVIVMARYPRSHPVNAYSRARVVGYARKNCPFTRVIAPEQGKDIIPIVIFGDCGAGKAGN